MKNKDQILLENLYNNILEKYYDSRKEPRDQPSEFGYFDADQLLGKRVWVHTNRTNRDQGRNGMLGVYVPKGMGLDETYSDKRYGYTNEIRLKDIIFDVDEPCLRGIKETGKRTLCAGIAGTIIKTEGNNSGFEEFTLEPKSGIFGYFRKNDPNKEIIVSADEVYMNGTEDGRYITLARGIKTQKII